MAAGQHLERRLSLLQRVDALLFVFAGVAAAWLAFQLIEQGLNLGWRSLLLVGFWVLFTYLLLPRLHRILTQIYVPGYFIGRTRTSDGLLGDPVNLGLLGTEEQIHAAMTAAGWTRADDLNLRSGMRIVTSTLSRRSYSQAPVSPLLLFDRQQDFAYQQEVAGSPSKRHHVRFWRCPEGWLLPGGYAADWLAAGTYDRAVGLSLFTLQITHKIEENTDIERDFIVRTVEDSSAQVSVRVIENFASGYHSRNGGGDEIQTDGDLPIVDLCAVAAEPVPSLHTDSRDRRPSQIVFGGGASILRGVTNLSVAVSALWIPSLLSWLSPENVLTGVPQADRLWAQVVLGVVFGLAALADVLLGLAIFAGRTWVRMLILLLSVLEILTAFGGGADTQQLSATGGLPSVALSILVMLSLTSHRAREYTARRQLSRKDLAEQRRQARLRRQSRRELAGSRSGSASSP